jgi:diamine N-acetyltransferase
MISKNTFRSQSKVTLREINKDTVREICKLEVTPQQTRFVASVAVSIAQAYFESKAWFKGIYADETPIGFVMLFKDHETPLYYIWRFMIDAQYQRMGFGKKAISLVFSEVRSWPRAKKLYVSYVPQEDGPGTFYHKLGFKPTGEMEGDENIAEVDLFDTTI